MSADANRIEQLLEDYYEQFTDWANHLTRGDLARAQDLVHDFCLHLAVTQPDLSSISNLEGYLYKSLRNIYLSILARSSREALQILSVVDYDSMQLAFAPRGTGDLLQLQNDLRRICTYSLWRKDQTKIASYFILRFFHGYQQHEIAEMVRSPIAVLYAKLREFRVEMRTYLRDSQKVRFLGQEKPPVQIYCKSLVSSAELFRELLQTIHGAKSGDCLPEAVLIEKYNASIVKPLSTSFLSHIVCCERCLNIIDGFFGRTTLDKRGPLDDDDVPGDAGTQKRDAAKDSRTKVLASVQRLRVEVLQHRPRILSIAIDGKIIASHTIQSQQDVLTARVEWPSERGFVEVFSEQGVRLAQLSIDLLPPEGPHQRVQHVDLSDDRWLELRLTFDGLGLGCEAVYFDAALAKGWAPEVDVEEFAALLPRVSRWNTEHPGQVARGKIARWLLATRSALRPITPSPTFAWTFVITAIAGIAGYFVAHNGRATPALSARDVLNRSIAAEEVSLKGKTEHQVLRFEETSAQGEIREQGIIEVWRDGDGKRYMRRFLDSNHRMMAAEWEQGDGRLREFSSVNGMKQGKKAEQLADDLWKQDLSVSAYRVLNDDNAHVRPLNDGYELTIAEPEAAHPELISATLIFDRSLHPIREVLQVRRGDEIRKAQFIQADYERKPSSEVPDNIFTPPDASLDLNDHKVPVDTRAAGGKVASDVELSQLYIAVLYQLSNLHADTSDPIEVERTAARRIRVVGMLADERRKQEILAGLNLIENKQFLELHLMSPSSASNKLAAHPQPIAETTSNFDVDQAEAPADVALRAAFQARGLSGPMQDEAVREFSRDILAHAQAALQHASILNRLGSGMDASVLRTVDFESQSRWTELIARHANALNFELQAINKQLNQISLPRENGVMEEKSYSEVEAPEQFAEQAHQLLIKVQNLNRTAGNIFAVGHVADAKFADIELLAAATRKIIPVKEAAEMRNFSVELSASETAAALKRQSPHDNHIP